MAKNKSKSQAKREASIAAARERAAVAEPTSREVDPTHVPDSGSMTTTDSLNPESADQPREDVNAEEKRASRSRRAEDAEKEGKVTVTFTSNINTRFGGKDYVGREFELPEEEAEALKAHVRELHGSGMIQ